MESSVNESIDHSVEAPHHKGKENDEQTHQQREAITAVENAAQITIPRSPDTFMETLAGKGQSFDEGSGASDPIATVEELTLNNYKGPSLVMGEGSSVRKSTVEELTLNNYKGPSLVMGEGSSVRKSTWYNFTMLTRGPRVKEDVGNFSMPENVGSNHLELNYSKVADHLVESDNRNALSSMLNRPAGKITTKVLTASGFPRFMVKNSLKGKGVTYRHPGVSKEPLGVAQSQHNAMRSYNDSEVDANSCDKSNGQVNAKALVGGGGQSSDTNHNDISLRQWLTPGHHKLDKLDRMQLFKQILKLVDASHSQGLVLQHQRPTYFLISPSNHITYVGSFVPKSQMEQLEGIDQGTNNYAICDSKRKIYWGNDNGSLSTKQRKPGESCKNHMILTSNVSNYVWQQPTLEILKWEEKWYACPEELNGSVCSFSSNIYSLGVLFFELFCLFGTWELHSTAMSDLRYRILPPTFLSESPKEAGFCLWLLHPEPSSRPNSRDILMSDLIHEGQDLPVSDQSSASIDEEDADADLLLHFLLNIKEQKEKQAAKLVADVRCLTTDIYEVEKRYQVRPDFLLNASGLSTISSETSDKCPLKGPVHVEAMFRFSGSATSEERLTSNLEQLENVYFSMRSKVELPESNAASRAGLDVLKIRNGGSPFQNDTIGPNEPTDLLGAFFEGLCKYARYSKFELCGTLRNVDILNTANVICSLSFDRDEDYFAAAGVSKKIKIFEFNTLLSDSVDIHYPLIEMASRSKLSCVCWNGYIKNYLASTDHEGVVQLWDASTGQGFTAYTEHQKRAWSVDFSLVDPTKLASGSDDCSVKLWSINERTCINTIRNVANVCCVQFSPYSSHLLAFGSADYKVYCYDLRMTRSPWCTLAGHGKAVSYVKFVDSVTVASASTDNSLKLWDLSKTSSSGFSTNACCLTLCGHTNEKNFVGLSVSDGYITCGSETNEVYAYYKTLPMPITSHKFGSIDPITGHDTCDDNGQFVSSVCWRRRSNMVVAANSSGTIKLLQMV